MADGTATRTLKSSPSILPLYLRAAAPLVPGASLLPFVPGRGREIPEIELTLPDVLVDAAKVASYAKVCGFTLTDTLPPTYPHVLAFPLHMAVMADGRFPFGAVGLVHVENRIVQTRPIAIGQRLSLTVWPTHIEPHPRGRTFSLLTEVRVGGEKVWEGVSTMLRRGGAPDTSKRSVRDGGPSSPDTPFRNTDDDGRSPDTPFRNTDDDGGGAPDTPFRNDAATGGRSPRTTGRSAKELEPVAEWRLPGDLGRRYAAVSGDRNPIHMHSLTAKPFGFPQAIAHGMWTKARCLAALQARLPDAFEVDVRFRKPISLPSKVQFAIGAGGSGDAGGRLGEEGGPDIDFEVRRVKDGASHLRGTLRPARTEQSDPRRK